MAEMHILEYMTFIHLRNKWLFDWTKCDREKNIYSTYRYRERWVRKKREKKKNALTRRCNA
jgi:hypothetical protein